MEEIFSIVLNFWISIVRASGANHTSLSFITIGAEMVTILMLKLLHDDAQVLQAIQNIFSYNATAFKIYWRVRLLRIDRFEKTEFV